MANEISTILSTNNEVFVSYCFWCSLLILKMLLMSILTGIKRFTRQVFANQEDVLSKKLKVKFDDPEVERVRRAHRNDLENIPIFFVVAFIYLWTNPNEWLASNLFRTFAVSRAIHTMVYAIYVVPQPARALAFFVGYIITAYMSITSVIYFLFK